MITLLAVAVLVAGPEFGVESLVTKCSEPKKTPLGFVSGQGRVQFEVSQSGRADTLTVRVVESSRLSAPALRSAIVRVLIACRHKSLADRLPAVVTQSFMFDSSTFSPGTASIVPEAWSQSDTLNTRPSEIPGPGPYPVTSPLLEERPRALACQVADPPRMMGSGLDAIATQQHMREGWVRLRFVVDSNGRSIEESISIVASSNPASSHRAVETIERCKFAPGRIGGIPVAVILFQELTME